VPAQTLHNVLIRGTELRYRAYFSKYPKEEPLAPTYTEAVRVLALKSRKQLIFSEDRGGIASEPWYSMQTSSRAHGTDSNRQTSHVQVRHQKAEVHTSESLLWIRPYGVDVLDEQSNRNNFHRDSEAAAGKTLIPKVARHTSYSINQWQDWH